MAEFGENWLLRSCRKVDWYCLQKKSIWDTFLPPPISPTLILLRQKFRERCQLLTWVCVLTLFRIGCGLPDLFWKVSKNSNKYRLSAYNNKPLLKASWQSQLTTMTHMSNKLDSTTLYNGTQNFDTQAFNTTKHNICLARSVRQLLSTRCPQWCNIINTKRNNECTHM